MTYLMTSNAPGDIETFRAICERVESHAAGLIARYAGCNDTGLAITTIWESKAACDRFTAEHLQPALVAILGDRLASTGPGVFVAFESLDEREIGRSS